MEEKGKLASADLTASSVCVSQEVGRYCIVLFFTYFFPVLISICHGGATRAPRAFPTLHFSVSLERIELYIPKLVENDVSIYLPFPPLPLCFSAKTACLLNQWYSLWSRRNHMSLGNPLHPLPQNHLLEGRPSKRQNHSSFSFCNLFLPSLSLCVCVCLVSVPLACLWCESIVVFTLVSLSLSLFSLSFPSSARPSSKLRICLKSKSHKVV